MAAQPRTARSRERAVSSPSLFASQIGVRELMRRCDWSATPLGPPEDWPSSLQAIVRAMLASRFAMWMAWGPDLTFLCNDAYLPTVGMKRDWVIGSRSDKVWAEIWPDIGPRIQHVLTTGEATWDEALKLYLERSGFQEETYHTFSYSPLVADDGVREGMLCVVAEVTERVFGERQLASLRDIGTRLAAASTRSEVMAALEAGLALEPRDVPFALVYLLEGGNEVRRAALHGLPPEHPLATQRIRLDAQDAPWRLARAAAGARVAKVARQSVANLALRHWQQAPKQALVGPIASAKGAAPTGYFVAGLNPHRRLDADYRGYVELLTAQISAALARAGEYERTQERAAALAEINRAKTAFFSNVSHEFRTPLTLMLGPLEDQLAEARALTGPQRERLEMAHRNALRLLRLVNSLLDFSRIEAGRAQASFRPTDLAAVTADLASAFRSATDKAGLRLAVDAPPLSRPVHVDADMWEKIVLNLMSNAFKFTLAGEIAVTLGEESGHARLSVRDSGVGIPAAELSKVFDRFHRVEGTQGRSHEGSGIGLALVDELTRQHGGAITVESEVGRGTTFTVRIPFGTDHLPAEQVAHAALAEQERGRAKAFVQEVLRWAPGEDDAPTDMIADAGADAETNAPGLGARVLLVDDNADLRAYIARLLSERGYEVETAPDGEAALAALSARRADLVLTDVMMPRLDGFGLLTAIRARPELREIPVIMLSARAGEDSRVEGLDGGADDYLIKPFEARELLARVGANIATARMRREAADALREVNATLEARVEERSRALLHTEEDLRQAQKMEAIGQLTGGIAHDFNNLLTVIAGNVDIAQRALDAGKSDRAERAMDSAQKGVERAATLTQRLLAFSRRQPLAPKALDLGRLVGDMSDLLSRALGELVRLEIATAPDLWLAEIDANQLEVAILNLAINARDAMPRGGTLTIETSNARVGRDSPPRPAEATPGDFVVISVTDTGVGMSRETLARAFEPFFTTKEVGKGTGLGLSMVYGFVKQSGGWVTIDSEIGQGASVRMFLPRLEREPEAADKPAKAAPDRGAPTQTVLMVEDDADVRAYTVEILRELGYEVLEAGDAATALWLLEGHDGPIALLFTDVVMPTLSGRELAERARRLRPDLKVLYTSGYTRDAIGHGGRLDPGVQLLAKPFTYRALAEKIAQVLAADGG